MPENILSCTGISKSFTRSVVPESLLQDKLLRRERQKRVTIDALSDVTFHVGRGEWVGINGPNGSGKTTLLRIIAGLLKADTGTVESKGKMSCFFDLSVGFHEERNAVENLLFHGLLQGIPARDVHALIGPMIEFAGLESHQLLPVKCYSLGMKMRLGFAAAVQTVADLYVMDEILAVGDAAFQVQCKEKLLSMKQAGASALIVSHSLEDLGLLCDRILFMDGGTIREERVIDRRPVLAAV